MSLIEEVHDALTMIPGLLAPEDCCHFSAASEPWREKLSYAMRDITDQGDRIEELEQELAEEERAHAYEEKRRREARDEADDLRSERDTLNRELGDALDKIKRLQATTTSARESVST